MFDADGSGSLSRPEVGQVLKALDIDNDSGALEAVFNAVDRDNRCFFCFIGLFVFSLFF